MNNNDFFKSLEYEQSMYSKADSFYKKLIQNIWFAEYKNDQIFISIKRWDFNTPEGKIKQLDDIDVTIDIEVNNRIYHYDISEKFRRDDYLDMFVELYSKYPNVEGWGVKSKANVIFYHTPNYLYIIDTNQLKEVAKNIMKIVPKVVDEMNRNGTYRVEEYYEEKDYFLDFIKTPTYLYNKKAWEGLGVCLPWHLFGDFNITMNKLSKNNILFK